MDVTLSENTKKYLGYGLLAVGIGAAVYAVYKMKKKPSSTGKLNGWKRKKKTSYKALK